MQRKLHALAAAILSLPVLAGANDLSLQLDVAYRWFPQEPADPRQYSDDGFVKLRAEWFHDWNDGDTRVVATPTVRWRQADDGTTRTDGDFEELYWRHTVGANDFYAGARKLFWGVTESVHLVDIVNQTDVIEDVDGEDKLGQPMVQWSSQHEWGDVDVILMPYFRERRFPGTEGRLRPGLPVSNDAIYESSDEENHLDAAVRWSRYVGDWDIGLSHFSGTAREPLFVLAPSGDELQPYYAQLEQTGLDVQATKGGWLWKLEAASRYQLGERSTRAAGGFEYTFYGVTDEGADLGVIAEYLFDDLGDRATTPFEDDVFVGARLAFNDVQGSEVLAGVILDREDDARFWSVEASRRLGERFKLSLTARIFSGLVPADVLYSYRNEDFVTVNLATYF